MFHKHPSPDDFSPEEQKKLALLQKLQDQWIAKKLNQAEKLSLDDWTFQPEQGHFTNNTTGKVALGDKHQKLYTLYYEQAKMDDQANDQMRVLIFEATDNLWNHLTDQEKKQVTKKEVLRYCAREAIVGMHLSVLVEDMWGPDEKTKEFVFKGYHVKFLPAQHPAEMPEGINKKPVNDHFNFLASMPDKGKL